MKQIAITLIALSLLPQLSPTQELPNAPVPVEPDPAWDRVRGLPAGQALLVVVDDAPPVHCMFSRATQDYLFCDPPDNPPGVGYRFDRAEVISVDLDLPGLSRTQHAPPRADWHPGLFAAAAGTGIAIGVIASERSGNPQAGLVFGLIAAGMVTSAGYPMLDIQSRRPSLGWEFPLHGFAGVRQTRLPPPIFRRFPGR